MTQRKTDNSVMTDQPFNEKALIVSGDFHLHQEVKNQFVSSRLGLIHTTEIETALQVMSKHSVSFLVWDVDDQDVASLREYSRNLSNKIEKILIARNPNRFSAFNHDASMRFLNTDDIHHLNSLIKPETPIFTKDFDIFATESINVQDNYDSELMKQLCKELVGESEAIRKVRDTVFKIADSNMSVLIRGESGSGKGVVARLIHRLSQRDGELVKINCPSIPETLFESELFGHEAGAYTGATGQKPGRLEIANKGTVFLDEIGEIPPMIQAKLLEFLETKQYNRVGSTKTKTLDTRIVSATNAPLEDHMKSQQFRTDLYYRLAEFTVNLPPLRNRISDIPILVDHFLKEFSKEMKTNVKPISNETMQLLYEYNWPGNVREMRSLMKAYAFSGDESIIINTVSSRKQEVRPDHDNQDRMEKIEQETILATLNETRWNQKKAAQILGISYSSIRRKIKKYQLAS